MGWWRWQQTSRGPVGAIKAQTLIRKFNIGVHAEFSFPSWRLGDPFEELSCLLCQTLNVEYGSICGQALNGIHSLIKYSISCSLDDLTSSMPAPLFSFPLSLSNCIIEASSNWHKHKYLMRTANHSFTQKFAGLIPSTSWSTPGWLGLLVEWLPNEAKPNKN